MKHVSAAVKPWEDPAALSDRRQHRLPTSALTIGHLFPPFVIWEFLSTVTY